MHRLPIFQDTRSYDERTERVMRDVRRKIDEDLQNFGFGRKNLLKPSGLAKRDDDDDDDNGPASRLLSHDFFKLRPSATTALQSPTSAGRLASPPPRKDDLGSRETLDEDTMKTLYTDQPQSAGRLFSMNFDVKDYDAEDITVTVEDNTLIVQAKHRMEKDGAVSIKEFNRKIKLPKDVDPEKLTSTLTSDGILTIEAQVPPDQQATVSSSAFFGPDGSDTSFNGNPLRDGGATSQSSLSQNTASTVALDTPVFSSDASTGRRKMDLILEVGKPYTPDDISVKLEGRKLIVEATHEEKWQGRTSKVSMQRDFDLKEDIDVSSVQALLKGTGLLTITAYTQ